MNVRFKLFTSDSLSAEKAKADMLCYKVCRMTENRLQLVAPSGETSRASGQDVRPNFPAPKCLLPGFPGGFTLLSSGLIRTFVQMADAESFRKSLKDEGYRTFECVIPRGTRFYRGVNAAGDPSYVSQTLTFRKEIICITQ